MGKQEASQLLRLLILIAALCATIFAIYAGVFIPSIDQGRAWNVVSMALWGHVIASELSI